MPAQTDKNKAAHLRSVRREVVKRCTKRDLALAQKFIAQFYANVPTRDLLSRSPEDLAGAALSIWRYGASRRPKKANIRSFSPELKRDGWHTNRTIIEVVTDDMPFLVDSVSAAVGLMNLTLHLVVHPIVRVQRDGKGELTTVLAPNAGGSGVVTESFMQFEVDLCSTEKERRALNAAIAAALQDASAAVEDWSAMRGQTRTIINELKLRYSEATAGDVAEAQDFLQWLHDDHFTFLGYREYDFKGAGAKLKSSVRRGSGLGILRDANRRVFTNLRELGNQSVEIQRLVKRADPLVVNKADIRSTVHRAVHLDAVGIKIFDDKGKVVGERLIVGLFTSVAYNSSPRDIPLLRRKIDKTIARAGLPQAGHDGKALMNILETYPRDELFQIHDDNLMDIATGILHLQERQRVALFVRSDDFNRFVSCLIYVPRDSFTTALRLTLQNILETELDGDLLSHKVEVSDSPLARLHVMIGVSSSRSIRIDVQNIEAKLVEAARSWADRIQAALIEAKGESLGNQLAAKYRDAFPTGYDDQFVATQAVRDIDKIENVLSGAELEMDLYRAASADGEQFRFKIFQPDTPLPLSDVLPMLEHMGVRVLDELPHRVRPENAAGRCIIIHDFGLVRRSGAGVEIEKARDNFHDVFVRVSRGDMESDGFNALVFGAQLTWRQITVLRCYAKYLRQAEAPFSQEYMEQALRNNRPIARKLVELFEAKFDPTTQAGHNRRVIRLRQNILDALEAVESADEDRIIRRFLNLVEASLRTNFYQTDTDGNPKSYLSVKFDSEKIDDLPLPRPLREIFVYSPRFEAIHLRGGLVARGGLRWSDRQDDFRTEVLGLVKAQMVKNVVIVPVGSKGGFVVKRPPSEGGRDAFLEEGITCYKMFMAGLLDITDNLQGSRLVAPKQVVRLDGDDPYLVVAADKGTATFSDIANGVSVERGFWLGDAFASGGSVGYDHKKMGITARGGWESVKRHFREIGKDIQKEEFTTVGVGDMSGDVFGNGMLLSKSTKLIAAFNHMHIFVDPDPDPAKSWAERRRLFNRPRSSWTDYDPKLISKGGDIFDRSAKSINLSAEIRAALDISKSTATPNELIQAILTAPVELLWFGGIGTYVKASSESHADADDRGNDGLRIDAPALRCQVVGEGANLGVTQRGRIEFGLGGGRINTDSIDNSAGVDASDHEVNIKILLDSVVAKRKLTPAQRNKLLMSMTNEVGELVLRDNYLQTQAITLEQSWGVNELDAQARFMRTLERAGRLDRSVEFLPDDEILEEREKNKSGLARPELAILMSYAKLWLYDELLATDLPDDKELVHDLIDYFPTPLRKKYRSEILGHKLRREIVATVITNDFVNRTGATFVSDRIEKTGASPVDVARAYIVVRDAFRLQEIWDQIENMDNKVSAETQTILLRDVNQLIDRATLFFLRSSGATRDISAAVENFAPGIAVLNAKLVSILPVEVTSRVNYRVERYVSDGVPRSLAQQVAYLLLLVSATDIIRAAGSCGLSVERVAQLYFGVGEAFGLGWLRYSAEKLPADTHWQKLASEAVIEEFYGHQRGITLRIVNSVNGAADPLAAWSKDNAAVVAQTRQMLNELESAETVDLSMLAVASRHLSSLASADDD